MAGFIIRVIILVLPLFAISGIQARKFSDDHVENLTKTMDGKTDDLIPVQNIARILFSHTSSSETFIGKWLIGMSNRIYKVFEYVTWSNLDRPPLPPPPPPRPPPGPHPVSYNGMLLSRKSPQKSSKLQAD